MNTFEKGFIDKNYILSKTTQENIFQMVFNFYPKEGEYCTSPFRLDNNPGCWFEYNNKNTLLFVDYATTEEGFIKIDCFTAIKKKYNLPNFYKTLEFIDFKIKQGIIKESKNNISKIKPIIKKKEVIIKIIDKPFDNDSLNYWKDYGITKEQLIEDKVFLVKRVFLYNSKKGDLNFFPKSLCFAFTDFNENRKKLYFPKETIGRFIGNCKHTDIGSIKNMNKTKNYLIITKSYKDCRVLKNLNFNSIWFQSESVSPPDSILLEISVFFKKIIVLYDNDKQGVFLSKEIVNKINMFFVNKAVNIQIPTTFKAKDSAEMYKKGNIKDLYNILINVINNT